MKKQLVVAMGLALLASPSFVVPPIAIPDKEYHMPDNGSNRPLEPYKPVVIGKPKRDRNKNKQARQARKRNRQ